MNDKKYFSIVWLGIIVEYMFFGLGWYFNNLNFGLVSMFAGFSVILFVFYGLCKGHFKKEKGGEQND